MLSSSQAHMTTPIASTVIAGDGHPLTRHDDRDRQSKALHHWEQQQRVWEGVRNHLAAHTGHSSHRGGAHRSHPRDRGPLCMDRAVHTRERSEHIDMIDAALPTHLLCPIDHTWQALLRTGVHDYPYHSPIPHKRAASTRMYDSRAQETAEMCAAADAERALPWPEERTHLASIGKAYFPYTVAARVRDPQTYRPDHPLFTRVIRADDAGCVQSAADDDDDEEEENDDVLRQAQREVARISAEGVAHCNTPNHNNRCRSPNVNHRGGRNSNNGLFADTLNVYASPEYDENDEYAVANAHSSYYASQMERVDVTRHRQWAHFALPRRFLALTGQPAPRQSIAGTAAAAACARDALTADNARDPAPVEWFPAPPQDVQLPSGPWKCRRNNKHAHDNERSSCLVADSEAVLQEKVTHVASLDSSACSHAHHSPPSNHHVSCSVPVLQLSTSCLHLHTFPGQLRHAQMTVRNCSAVTVYYRLVCVDPVAESMRAAGVTDECAAAHSILHRAAHHTQRARRYFYLSHASSGVCLPYSTITLTFTLRAEEPGYFSQCYELRTVPHATVCYSTQMDKEEEEEMGGRAAAAAKREPVRDTSPRSASCHESMLDDDGVHTPTKEEEEGDRTNDNIDGNNNSDNNSNDTIASQENEGKISVRHPIPNAAHETTNTSANVAHTSRIELRAHVPTLDLPARVRGRNVEQTLQAACATHASRDALRGVCGMPAGETLDCADLTAAVAEAQWGAQRRAERQRRERVRRQRRAWRTGQAYGMPKVRYNTAVWDALVCLHAEVTKALTAMRVDRTGATGGGAGAQNEADGEKDLYAWSRPGTSEDSRVVQTHRRDGRYINTNTPEAVLTGIIPTGARRTCDAIQESIQADTIYDNRVNCYNSNDSNAGCVQEESMDEWAWDGCVMTLMARVMELRDAAARGTLLEAVYALLQLATVSRRANEGLCVLMDRLAQQSARHRQQRGMLALHREVVALQSRQQSLAASASVSVTPVKKSRPVNTSSRRSNANANASNNNNSNSTRVHAHASTTGSIGASINNNTSGMNNTTNNNNNSIYGVAASTGMNNDTALGATVAISDDEKKALGAEYDALMRTRVVQLQDDCARWERHYRDYLGDIIDAACHLPILDVVQAWRCGDVRRIEHSEVEEMSVACAVGGGGGVGGSSSTTAGGLGGGGGNSVTGTGVGRSNRRR